MNCNWTDARMSSYLDGELDGAEMRKVRAHVDSCENCRVEFEALKAAKTAIEELPVYELPDGFEEALVAKVFAHESLPARRRTSLVLAGGMAFCAAFLGVTMWLQSSRSQKVEEGAQVAQSTFELDRDQAYAAGSDPLAGSTVVMTSTHGMR